MSCSTCRFMHEGPPMHCRRFPPTVVIKEDQHASTFPVVGEHMSCGEYKRRPWWERLQEGSGE
jgi:hypothetical protein